MTRGRKKNIHFKNKQIKRMLIHKKKDTETDTERN